MKRCTFCGGMISDAAKFCEHCGAPVGKRKFLSKEHYLSWMEREDEPRTADETAEELPEDNHEEQPMLEQKPDSEEHSSKKKRGCLFPFLILLVLFAVITMIGNVGFTGLTQSGFSVSDLIDSLDDSSDDGDSSWYDAPIECMVGTWESRTTGDRITFHADGSLTVSSGSTAVDCAADDVFCRLTDSPRALSEDNRDRAADYPPEDYYYCEFSMFPKDEDGGYLDFPTFDLLIFIPRDLYESETPPESGTEIAAFRYDEFDSSADSYLDTYVRQ